jgi:hypothetical protein
MPQGKPAGVACVQLTEDFACRIFADPLRPACCTGLQPNVEMCGSSRQEALVWLTALEDSTRPPTVRN